MLDIFATTEDYFSIGGVPIPRGADKSRKLSLELFKYGDLHAGYGDFEGYRVLLESGEKVSISAEHQAGGGFFIEIPELRVLRLTLGRTLIEQLGLQGDGNDVWVLSMGQNNTSEAGMVGRNKVINQGSKFEMKEFGHVLGK